jgi:hypothetical protein
MHADIGEPKSWRSVTSILPRCNIQGERDAHDHPTAFLICDEHKSLIHTVHPDVAGAQDTPWFPSQNGGKIVKQASDTAP